MIIKEKTEMILFRYCDYRSYNFIDEHLKVLDRKGYVWMLKSGRKTNESAIETIIHNGGYLVLKSPKKSGNSFYLAKVIDYSVDEPEEDCFPSYYSMFANEEERYESVKYNQWFKILAIEKLSEIQVESLVLKKSKKKLADVINSTRTAVMFVVNMQPWIIKCQEKGD